MTEYYFTTIIRQILTKQYADRADTIFSKSKLLQYVNEKTVSANKGSKSRGSFANLYAIYVLIEDYINNGYLKSNKKYSEYEGAIFSNLMKRQRKLPFGAKLQNHALNSRMNEEFRKFFPSCEQHPIVRDLKEQRYWINEQLLIIKIEKKEYNIASVIITIINKYIETKQEAFKNFVSQCHQLQKAKDIKAENINAFIFSLLNPNMDARLFEIVSFAILKRLYSDRIIYWGYSKDNLKKENIKLYKTGRTNANDGGIDFVMRPLGRFFQATETLDFKKYFLDIDKLEHYPVTFVVKSDENIDLILKTIQENALKTYGIKRVVESYMNCIEEIINLPTLKQITESMSSQALKDVLEEIIRQSNVEFNQ